MHKYPVSLEYWQSGTRTYKSLQSGESDTTAIGTSHKDSLATDALSKDFGNFDTLSVGSKGAVRGGRHDEYFFRRGS